VQTAKRFGSNPISEFFSREKSPRLRRHVIKTLVISVRSLILLLFGLHLPAAWAQAPSAGEPNRTDADTAGRHYPNRILWGDTHLHTDASLDSGAFGNRLGLDEAYRFARGKKVTTSTGVQAKLTRPLDFLVVADHSDNLGFFPDLLAGTPQLLQDPTGKDWHDRIKAGETESLAIEMLIRFSRGRVPEALIYTMDSAAYRSAWQKNLAAAEKYNDPGTFTALIGYEWTSTLAGSNLHRIVVYRDGSARAGQMVPYTTTPPDGSRNPRDLWKWLARYEAQTGGDVLAISHNGNLSNGILFPLGEQYDGTALDAQYLAERSRWEPLYETTQTKGDSEAHPLLSPNDEFADYGTWDLGNLGLAAGKTEDMLAGEYAREALKRGLVIAEQTGLNPYRFGLIGSTDSHTSLASAEEENFYGMHPGHEPTPERITQVAMSNKKHGTIFSWQQVAAGLAAVWATDNTRAALFDAMMRKEVYATTGSRPAVRFFGGWHFNAEDLNNPEPATAGYSKGVPMGGDLQTRPGSATAPTFMVYALRDVSGANLDRIQIIKGWLDENGAQEKVYDVVWSDDRQPGRDGKLPPVGNTVDARTATWTNTIGAADLATVWSDPEFDADQRAFYYARIVEIPTPRWTTYDAVRFDVALPAGVPASTQERAYTSPIWYTPR
jgi:hypothetical protein